MSPSFIIRVPYEPPRSYLDGVGGVAASLPLPIPELGPPKISPIEHMTTRISPHKELLMREILCFPCVRSIPGERQIPPPPWGTCVLASALFSLSSDPPLPPPPLSIRSEEPLPPVKTPSPVSPPPQHFSGASTIVPTFLLHATLFRELPRVRKGGKTQHQLGPWEIPPPRRLFFLEKHPKSTLPHPTFK